MQSTCAAPIPHLHLLLQRRDFIPATLKQRVIAGDVDVLDDALEIQEPKGKKSKGNVPKERLTTREQVEKAYRTQSEALETIFSNTLRNYDVTVRAVQDEFRHVGRVLHGVNLLYNNGRAALKSEASAMAKEKYAKGQKASQLVLHMQNEPWSRLNGDQHEFDQSSAPFTAQHRPLFAHILTFLPMYDIQTFLLVSLASRHLVQEHVPVSFNSLPHRTQLQFMHSCKHFLHLSVNDHPDIIKNAKSIQTFSTHFSKLAVLGEVIAEKLILNQLHTCKSSSFVRELTAPNLRVVECQHQMCSAPEQAVLRNLLLRPTIRGIHVHDRSTISGSFLLRFTKLEELTLPLKYFATNRQLVQNVLSNNPRIHTLVLSQRYVVDEQNFPPAWEEVELFGLLKFAPRLKHLTMELHYAWDSFPANIFFELAAMSLDSLSIRGCIESKRSVSIKPLLTRYISLESTPKYRYPFYKHLTERSRTYDLICRQEKDITTFCSHLKANPLLHIRRVTLHFHNLKKSKSKDDWSATTFSLVETFFTNARGTSVCELLLQGASFASHTREEIVNRFCEIQACNESIGKVCVQTKDYFQEITMESMDSSMLIHMGMHEYWRRKREGRAVPTEETPRGKKRKAPTEGIQETPGKTKKKLKV